MKQLNRAVVLMVASSFLVGALAGALTLRAWQKTKPYILSPKMSWLDARREMLNSAKRWPSIVMLGDSITFEVPWAETAECATVANYGVGGDTAGGVLERLDDVIRAKPRAVFLLVGTNDIGFRTPAATTAESIRTIVDRLTSNGIVVIVHPVLPIQGARELVDATNRAIAKGLEGSKAIIAPLPIEESDLRDGVHLAPSGFAKWHKAVRQMMAEHC